MPAKHMFDDLPLELQTFLEANEDFIELKNLFIYFLKKLKNNLHTHNDHVTNAARAFVVLRYMQEEFKEFLKDINEVFIHEQRHHVPELFESYRIPSQPLDEGFTVSIKPKLFCSITNNNKPAAHEWLKDQGLGDIIKPEVNPRTLVSAMEELIETQGIEPPNDIFSCYFTQVASSRVSRKKQKPGLAIEETLAMYADMA
jgi:hypothetical protein